MKKCLASLMILILSLGSVVNLQAYEEDYKSMLYYQTYKDDSSFITIVTHNSAIAPSYY